MGAGFGERPAGQRRAAGKSKDSEDVKKKKNAGSEWEKEQREKKKRQTICARWWPRAPNTPGFGEEPLLLIQSVYMHNKNLITIEKQLIMKAQQDKKKPCLSEILKLPGFSREKKHAHNE